MLSAVTVREAINGDLFAMQQMHEVDEAQRSAVFGAIETVDATAAGALRVVRALAADEKLLPLAYRWSEVVKTGLAASPIILSVEIPAEDEEYVWTIASRLEDCASEPIGRDELRALVAAGEAHMRNISRP